MKKTLIALAALAASGATLAQSSVTLYGVADAGIGKYKGGKVEMVSSSILNNSGSFLGFKGAEDLGGGLKAGFNFEQGISIENGSSDDQTNQGFLVPRTAWQRAANLWLGGTWGTFRMGRAYTPSYNALAAWGIMGHANYSAILHSFGAPGGDNERRQSSQISYKTPDFGGFSAEFGYVLKADNNDRAKMDLGLIYANGPLSAGLSYNKTKNLKASYAVGAQYSFGSFALAGGYVSAPNGRVNDPNTGAFTGNLSSKINGFVVGGKVYFGALSVALDVARHTKAEYVLDGVRFKDKKYTNGTLEAKYALSKRTFAYAVYIRNWGENGYGLGLQHQF